MSRPAKRQKKIEDNLICRINLNLPLDPVVADDGYVYERAAIEQYIKSNCGGDLKSPTTRKKMGTKLIAGFKIKNRIETMIAIGAITGESAEDWTKRFKEKKATEEEKKAMEDLLKTAERGDVDAMEYVAYYYQCGRDGFKQDPKMAYKWWNKARVAGSVRGMAKVGQLLVHGHGVEKDKSKGMVLLGMAEGRGSTAAAYLLGDYMMDGKHGFPVDKAMARQLLEKCVSGKCLVTRQRAQRKLDELWLGPGKIW